MKEISNQAAAAKAIRAELKAAFPGTKFSVRSKSFSMGDSVDIEWTDGPRTDAVKAITDKYQYGHFDGMTDMYEYSNRDSDLPQSKYVMTQRSMSAETRGIIIENIERLYGIDLSNDIETWNQFNSYPGDVIYREFNSGWYTDGIVAIETVEEKPEPWMQSLIDCGCI